MILIIDNYDSFTYNLVQYIGIKSSNIEVYKNNKITIEEIKKKNPTHIIISPGPGHPYNSGISIELIKHIDRSIPILGICLGHQAIALAFGGEIKKLNKIVHGKTSFINHDQSLLFNSIPTIFEATRYHSLIVNKKKLPKSLKITAKMINGTIMGLQHQKYPIFGLQFHPESILTKFGMKIISNFLNIEK